MEIPSPSFLDVYKECLEKFSETQNSLSRYGSSADALRGILQLEKERLTSWGQSIGLNRASVIVGLLQRDLHALQELKLLSQLEESGDRDRDGLSWGIERKENAQSLAHQLKVTNDELFTSLPVVQSEQIMTELRLIRLSQLVEIKDLNDLLKFQLMNSEIDVDTQIHTLTKLKEQRLRLGTVKGPPNPRRLGDEDDEKWAPQLRKRLLVRTDQPNIATFQTGRREMAIYDKKPVFIEWKDYDHESATGREGMEIFRRVQRLAAMLHTKEHSSLRSLRCLGYFEDESEDHSRYCFVYSLPDGSNPRKPPVSLLDFIESKWQPSLESRIYLAKELATCILNLHAVGWLHKGLRSENIIFFPQEDGSPRSLHTFYLVGFEYARRQGVDEFSEKLAPNPEVDIYRHPHCLRPDVRFSKTFEYYSLGIILLEIARWTIVHRILHTEVPIYRRQVKQSDIGKVRAILLHQERDKLATELDFRMGSKYRKATYTCLSGDLGIDSREDESGEYAHKLLRAYAKRVVEELEGCMIR